MKTTNRRVYSIGDVAGGLQFTHVAGYQAGVIIRSMLFGLPSKAKTSHIPWATYTDPELAQVGLTEEREAKRYPGGGPAMVKRENGLVIQCTVVDISLTGAAFSTEGANPFVGEIVIAGKLKGEVVRSGDGKFAVRYLHDK